MARPGNANLPIGGLRDADREIGVPRFHPIDYVPSVRCFLFIELPVGFEAVLRGQRKPVEAERRIALFDDARELQIS